MTRRYSSFRHLSLEVKRMRPYDFISSKFASHTICAAYSSETRDSTSSSLLEVKHARTDTAYERLAFSLSPVFSRCLIRCRLPNSLQSVSLSLRNFRATCTSCWRLFSETLDSVANTATQVSETCFGLLYLPVWYLFKKRPCTCPHFLSFSEAIESFARSATLNPFKQVFL